MKEYYIDFEGFCTIKADSKEEAESKFWEEINPISFKNIYDDYYDIETIEEK